MAISYVLEFVHMQNILALRFFTCDYYYLLIIYTVFVLTTQGGPQGMPNNRMGGPNMGGPNMGGPNMRMNEPRYQQQQPQFNNQQSPMYNNNPNFNRPQQQQYNSKYNQ